MGGRNLARRSAGRVAKCPGDLGAAPPRADAVATPAAAIWPWHREIAFRALQLSAYADEINTTYRCILSHKYVQRKHFIHSAVGIRWHRPPQAALTLIRVTLSPRGACHGQFEASFIRHYHWYMRAF